MAGNLFNIIVLSLSPKASNYNVFLFFDSAVYDQITDQDAYLKLLFQLEMLIRTGALIARLCPGCLFEQGHLFDTGRLFDDLRFFLFL